MDLGQVEQITRDRLMRVGPIPRVNLHLGIREDWVVL